MFFSLLQNAFWFGLGWGLFFFVPVIVVGVKLSKYYRKLNETDDDDDDEYVVVKR